jgi:superfamily II DNA/RNA helicase
MVATDIAARGINVDGIDLVIHSDPPAEHKAYVHRSGRTARGGNDGVVVTLQTAQQKREVRKLMREAGVNPQVAEAQPDSDVLIEIGGPPAERVHLPRPVTAMVKLPTRHPARGGDDDRSGGGRTGGGRRPSGRRRTGGSRRDDARLGEARHGDGPRRAGGPRREEGARREDGPRRDDAARGDGGSREDRYQRPAGNDRDRDSRDWYPGARGGSDRTRNGNGRSWEHSGRSARPAAGAATRSGGGDRRPSGPGGRAGHPGASGRPGPGGKQRNPGQGSHF